MLKTVNDKVMHDELRRVEEPRKPTRYETACGRELTPYEVAHGDIDCMACIAAPLLPGPASYVAD